MLRRIVAFSSFQLFIYYSIVILTMMETSGPHNYEKLLIGIKKELHSDFVATFLKFLLSGKSLHLYLQLSR